MTLKYEIVNFLSHQTLISLITTNQTDHYVTHNFQQLISAKSCTSILHTCAPSACSPARHGRNYWYCFLSTRSLQKNKIHAAEINSINQHNTVSPQ